MSKQINIAIMASGEGTNAENIIQYFQHYLDTKVVCLITNKKNAGVIKRIRKYKVPTYTTKWYKEMDKYFTEHNVHYIALAGYLDKIPKNFCNKYKNKILNIHPSLLPKYGGQGMYGDNIHKLVHRNKDKKTGITVHIVNEHIDAGRILFQKEIHVDEGDRWEDIKSKVQDLEYKFYPKIIENFIKGTYSVLYE